MNTKRILATISWFYAGWMASSFVGMLLGFNDMVGPLTGVAVAAVVAGDPLHRIWGSAVSHELAKERPNSLSTHT